MSPNGSFAFAQARLQARLGARSAAGDWRRLAAMRNQATVLQAMRETPFAPWVQGLGPGTSSHEIERQLRAGWTQAVEEIANWQPAPWQAATRWLAPLVYLPALQKLARGGRAPGWMRDDPVLGKLVAQELAERAAELSHSDLAPLQAGFADPPDVPGAWAKHWRSLWPGRRRPVSLERLIDAVARYRRRLASLLPEESSEELQNELDHRLQIALRRNPMSITASVAYLGLLAIDATRLRGVLSLQALRAQPEADS